MSQEQRRSCTITLGIVVLCLVFGILLGSLLIFVWSTWFEPLIPVQNVIATTEDKSLRQHWEAIARCRREGGRPVMGFDYAVICLDPSSVRWIVEVKDSFKID